MPESQLIEVSDRAWFQNHIGYWMEERVPVGMMLHLVSIVAVEISHAG